MLKQGILSGGGRICTVDLLVLTDSDQLFLILQYFFLQNKASPMRRSTVLAFPFSKGSLVKRTQRYFFFFSSLNEISEIRTFAKFVQLSMMKMAAIDSKTIYFVVSVNYTCIGFLCCTQENAIIISSTWYFTNLPFH